MEEAGFIFMLVLGIGGLVWFAAYSYLERRHAQKFWREIHMNAGKVVRENKRRAS